MRAQPKASHFIDGEYVEDTDGTVIESIYPATGEVIARLHAATSAIVEKAIAAAKRAQPEWAAMSPTARGRILKRAADIMRERNRELSELETLDTGKPIQETIVADPTSGADSFEFFGGIAAAGLNGSISRSAATLPIPSACRSASVSASAHGTIRSRSPAGRGRLLSSPATPWYSSPRKTRRSAR